MTTGIPINDPFAKWLGGWQGRSRTSGGLAAPITGAVWPLGESCSAPGSDWGGNSRSNAPPPPVVDDSARHARIPTNEEEGTLILTHLHGSDALTASCPSEPRRIAIRLR